MELQNLEECVGIPHGTIILHKLPHLVAGKRVAGLVNPVRLELGLEDALDKAVALALKQEFGLPHHNAGQVVLQADRAGGSARHGARLCTRERA